MAFSSPRNQPGKFSHGLDRLGDSTAIGDVLGYARVSTGDQDVAGQTMRLEHAGAIRVFTDVRSGKSMDRPGLTELLAYARRTTPWRSCALTVWVGPSPSCCPSSSS